VRRGSREHSDPTGVGARLHEVARSGELAHLPLVDIGEMLREQLVAQSLPSWCSNTLDQVHGGFLLDKGRWLSLGRRDGDRRGKQLVSQSRMLWVLSHAHLHEVELDGHDLLARATDGYRFLREHFHDGEHGGYFWKTNRSGDVRDDRKVLYAHAFVIYALVEFSRASGDGGPLQEALALWRIIMDRLHDRKHRGWVEHARPDWSPLGDRALVPVGRSGVKSANTHLHWMEALTELFAETRDPAVQKTVEEAVDLLSEHCFPVDPRSAHSHFTPAWERVLDSDASRFSLGHNVEFAWLVLHAENLVGRTPSVDRLVDYLDHALESGFDETKGGLNTHADGVGTGGSPRRRIWWVQAELLVALAVALDRAPNGERYEGVLRRHLSFVFGHQIDPRDGVWWEEVDADGRITKPEKQHDWKAGYHEIRSMMLVSDLLGRAGSGRLSR
jgi:mannose/cellobiose epimerase-like protein (N-acyl-D-glucosamine 2-epimerase family)